MSCESNNSLSLADNIKNRTCYFGDITDNVNHEFKIKHLISKFQVGYSIEILHPGTDLIQEYIILNHLGAGSYGVVVLAQLKTLSEDSPVHRKSSYKVEVADKGNFLANIGEEFVAIKIIDLEIANSYMERGDSIIMAQKEINFMTDLQDCPEILRYYATFSTDSYLFLIMEYAQGGSLYNLYTKYGSFPEDIVACVAYDILRSLIRLHDSSLEGYIVHNDIKSANILLSDKCICKLADFGVAREVNRHHIINDKLEISAPLNNGSSNLLGSPYWMAPEIILGYSCTSASDIWSFGITLLELALGRIPWPTTFISVSSLLQSLVNSAPPQRMIRKEIKALFSSEFWDFIDNCLQTQPNSRKAASVLIKHPFIRKRKRSETVEDYIAHIQGKRRSQLTNNNILRIILNKLMHIHLHLIKNLFLIQSSNFRSSSKNDSNITFCNQNKYNSKISEKQYTQELFTSKLSTNVRSSPSEDLISNNLHVENFHLLSQGKSPLSKRISVKSLSSIVNNTCKAIRISPQNLPWILSEASYSFNETSTIEFEPIINRNVEDTKIINSKSDMKVSEIKYTQELEKKSKRCRFLILRICSCNKL
ncbi:protein kinase domain-containing protein [Cryptosporidium andersoni]|uniref:Protein kinase domain-containing protein n=1 Tax=Cryptosporidium andersoni TaxID=117008 RepID=A0A1J4MNS8_9CRYT|nr:protein kinase domain-containing protein [Cryptosporidium andersoni]